MAERPRKEPISTTRPTSPPAAARVAAANRRRACASVSQPSTSRACAHASSKVTTRAAARRRRRRAVSPSARIDDAATHCTPNTIVAKSTMPSLPAVSRKGSAMATTPSTHRKRVSPSATMYWTVR